MYVVILYVPVKRRCAYGTGNWIALNHFPTELHPKTVDQVRSMESMVSLDEHRVRSDNSSRCFCFLRTFQCKHSAKEANQSEIWSWAQIDGTG